MGSKRGIFGESWLWDLNKPQADYDAEGTLADIEILDAVKHFGGQETLSQVVIEGVGLVVDNKEERLAS